MSTVPLLKPPKGFRSWLHYAVETMDTRLLHVESLFSDDEWGRENKPVSREKFQEAARKELEEYENQSKSSN